MSSPANRYWNAYYEKHLIDPIVGPTPFLRQMLPRLQKGKVLEIAMGEGINAVFLAQQGFQVRGFDVSDIAIKRANINAKVLKVEIEAKQADLDMFLLGLMEYESIIMLNFKPQVARYYSDMARALKQGGTLLIESLMSEEMKEPISKDESFKNFYFEVNELITQLKGLHILFYQENQIEGKHVVQCLARKPLDKDAAKYNLFDMSAKNIDTGPSHHQKLAEALFKK